MPRKKRKYTPKPFESTGVSNDVSANIYKSMTESAAFKDLTKNQQLLYVYMKLQYYGNKNKPGKDFPECEALQGNEVFYFNFALAESYGLYSKGNRGGFYKDVHALEEKGFIKTISNGRGTQTKSIYAYDSKWKYL